MLWQEQGAADIGRHAVIPRTLSFLTSGQDVLLLRGAPTKRLWANRLNGIGGHVEPGEDVLASARREIVEETGLEVAALTLRGVIHVSSISAGAGVLLIVFTGQATSRQVRPSPEGTLEWHPLDALPRDDLVADLPELLPRLFGPRAQSAIYALYTLNAAGEMEYRFVD